MYDNLKFRPGVPLKGQGVADATDLPRFAGRALIGDPRNDENSIVSQLQGLFLRFHNRMVDDNPGLSFEAIQQRVRFHYQYVVLNDFLPRIVSNNVLTELKTGAHYDRSKVKYFHWKTWPFMPVEFSVACYRLGHSMIRPGYRLKFKGLESFKGKCYHTSQWPHDGVDFTAKRVGVIGTGATGVQAIPEIAQQAKHLTVFQRTPTFCVPARNGRVDPEVTTARKADYDGIRQRIKNSFFGFELNFILKSVLDTTPEEREQEFDRMWDVGGFPFWLANYQDMFFSKEANDVIADYLKRKIRATVNDPVVAEKLTPKTYPYGTKRQPLDTNYLETFNKKNVVLVDASTDGPIEEITPNGIRAGGKEYPLDIIVVATGFDALTGSLKQLGIKGRGGRALAQEWEEGPQTYLGLAIAGYPNLFTITGPQSPSVLSNVPVSIEQHVEWITECIAHMRRNKLATIEATPQAQDAWGTHVSEVVNGTLLPGTNSWYMGANVAGKARRFLPYLGPEGVGGYRRKCAEVAEKGYEGFVFASEGRGGTVHTIAAE